MYKPNSFDQADPAKLFQLIEDYPLATVTVVIDDVIDVDHIPFYSVQMGDGKSLLRGHIARANSLYKQVQNGQQVTVIFHGPSAYISPGWYPTKKLTGKAVPTWNYAVVHILGSMALIDDDRWKMEMLAELTRRQERHFHESWQLDDAPADYIKKQLTGIIGIEITIESINGKWKMSQNQPAENQSGVISGLSNSVRLLDQETAQFMQKQSCWLGHNIQ